MPKYYRPPTPESTGPIAAYPQPDIDERLSLLIDWLSAVDTRNASAGVEASRRLRSHGISICLVAPARPGGGSR